MCFFHCVGTVGPKELCACRNWFQEAQCFPHMQMPITLSPGLEIFPYERVDVAISWLRRETETRGKPQKLRNTTTLGFEEAGLQNGLQWFLPPGFHTLCSPSCIKQDWHKSNYAENKRVWHLRLSYEKDFAASAFCLESLALWEASSHFVKTLIQPHRKPTWQGTESSCQHPC